MKKLGIILLLVGVTMTLSACGAVDSPDRVQQKQTEQIMQEINLQVGMPAIKNFQEKKLAKMIFELRDQENFSTITYITDLNGKLHKLCNSIGYGLPYSVQYTNPMRRIGDGIDGEIATLPQADPNGLFMPDGLSATRVMCVAEDGKPRPVYIEQQIVVSPFPLNNN